MTFNRSFAVIGVLVAIAVSAGAITASAGGTRKRAPRSQARRHLDGEREPRSHAAAPEVAPVVHRGAQRDRDHQRRRDRPQSVARRVEADRGRKYGSTAIFFRYDPVSGAYIGTLKLRHELEVAHGRAIVHGSGRRRATRCEREPAARQQHPQGHGDRRADQRRAASRSFVTAERRGLAVAGPLRPVGQVASVLSARSSEAAAASLSSTSTCAPPESTNGKAPPASSAVIDASIPADASRP